MYPLRFDPLFVGLVASLVARIELATSAVVRNLSRRGNSKSAENLDSKFVQVEKYFEKMMTTSEMNSVNKAARGRCYDHNFLRFLPFSAKKWRFSQKPML
jgi:hypothetical protein